MALHRHFVPILRCTVANIGRAIANLCQGTSKMGPSLQPSSSAIFKNTLKMTEIAFRSTSQLGIWIRILAICFALFQGASPRLCRNISVIHPNEDMPSFILSDRLTKAVSSPRPDFTSTATARSALGPERWVSFTGQYLPLPDNTALEKSRTPADPKMSVCRNDVRLLLASMYFGGSFIYLTSPQLPPVKKNTFAPA